MSKAPHIVVIGGGTGSFVVASGLSKTPAQVSMVMAMADDGGSNKIIRDEFGLLPTSGIRQAIVALSENKGLLRQLFTYRYHQGGPGLEGMTFGNLFMAAMADITGSQKKGIEETCKLLQVKGNILPVSYDDVRLVATYENGTEVVGEHYIDEPEHGEKLRITDLRNEPVAKLNPEVEEALMSADLVVIGPGDFYTNTVANLVVEGLVEALEKSPAKLVFVTNLMTSPSETPDYKLSDFFNDLKKYMPLNLIDYVLVNDNHDFPAEILKIYQDDGQEVVDDDLTSEMFKNGTKIIQADLLSAQVHQPVKGDVLARSMIRHDPDKLAKELMKVADE